MWSGQVPDWLLFVFQSFSRLVWMLHLYGCVLFTLSGICLWHHSLLTSHDSVKRVRRISLQVTAGTGVFLPLPSEPELRWSSERWRLSEQRQGCQSLQSHSLRERQAQHELWYSFKETAHSSDLNKQGVLQRRGESHDKNTHLRFQSKIKWKINKYDDDDDVMMMIIIIMREIRK